ncbi:hypothetical protein SS50377_21162 [Spironucleus salmonicida]|uniref:Uncharacterized protein n=1 Tax=Spironucleus salmonicida TaxID=348837 RepID=V6LHZ6_9EUKA|nr:hypothetical protein SS50377_21162 [Spironucleus salmonicida]|eukprot:EST43943.1 Hypothetical protein SS50377_16245 [Spironucleus salmonicida]
MQPSYQFSNFEPITQFFTYKHEISTSLSPSALLLNYAIVGSQILSLKHSSSEKVSKFAQPSIQATIRADNQLLAATHSNSISISAIRTKSVLKQFKTIAAPIQLCFLGTTKIAAITKQGHVTVWDIAIGEIIFAIQLKIELNCCLQVGEKLVVLGQNQIIALNVESREVQFSAKKHQSVVEFEQKVGEYKGRVISVNYISQNEILICTDLGMQIADIKQNFIKASCQIIKGVSQAINVNNELFFACLDGSIRSCGLDLTSSKVLERFKHPLLFLSRFLIGEQTFFSVSTSKPIVYILGQQPPQIIKQVLKKFNLTNQPHSQHITLPKPQILPQSIELLMKNRAYGKALDLALSNDDLYIQQNIVMQILFDVVSSNEKALASTVFYLADDSKINFYKLVMNSFGQKEFGVLSAAVLYQLKHLGIEQGLVGQWQQKVVKMAVEWNQMEGDLAEIQRSM